MEVFGKTQSETAILQRANGFLEGFFIGLADAHDFADGTHLSAQAVFGIAEFFKSPAGELHHHIIAGGSIFFQGAFPPVGQLIQGQSGRQLGGYQGDGKAGGLGSQGRRTGSARIDFDYHYPPGFGIMGKLEIGPSDNSDSFNYPVGKILKAFLQNFD